MISTSNNPWEEITPGGERLIDGKSKFEFLWGVERNGSYALYIPITNPENLPKKNISIKHLEIHLYESPLPRNFLWVIVLKNKEHWNIFKKLCEDLYAVSEAATNEGTMVSHLIIRLKNWQDLLARDIKDFPITLQMGLYSELKILKEIIAPKIGLRNAISAWVGGEKDKQDFLLDKCAIEVKSYRTTKGEIVQISSKEQLYTEKDYLYLISCALTESNTGNTVYDIASQIKVELKSNLDFNMIDLFENKLINYGYTSVLIKEEDLFRFILDKFYIYKVNNMFPRIISKDVPLEILSVKYELNLSSCKNFIIDQDLLQF